MEFTLNIHGLEFVVEDSADSNSVGWIEYELIRDFYRVRRMEMKKNDIVVDIGAHVGVFSIYMAKLFPDIRIIAIEPDAINYQYLIKNIARNKAINIEPINLGVSDHEATIFLHRPLHNSGGTSIYRPALIKSVKSAVPALTLNTIFEKLTIQQCKLVKVDCEGSEYHLFNGFKYFDRIDYIAGEIHDGQYIPCFGELSTAFEKLMKQNFTREKMSFSHGYLS
ncbi:MAG: FkbM family methyltransferase [Pedobacter sp.]|nr:FkbM family methyltransferase [Pedobacter sp.]